MSRELKIFVLLILSAFTIALTYGCGSSHKEAGAEPPLEGATKVGSETCTNTCHATTVDITGTPIAAAWAASHHTTEHGVQCEDCHGPGSLHFGVGPIPFPTPQAAQCLTCHNGSRAADKAAFLQTSHANPNLIPDKNFTQIATPVSSGKHIEECSVCHNVNQRFEFDIDGNLVKPKTSDDLLDPQVSCASCHDGHRVAHAVSVPQRSDDVHVPIFRKFVVKDTGEQSTSGTSFEAIIHQPNGAVQPDGSVDLSKVVGTNNELNVERLCASCHAKGTYKNSGGFTHQQDIFYQWKQSGHADRNEPAFASFAANPPAYTNPNTGLPYPAGGHQSLWPFDLALENASGNQSFNGPGKVGATANTTRNAGFGGTNDNFACYRCHNGVTSIAFQDNTQGTPDAPVVFGDEPITCITCHDPHKNYEGQSKNVRRPVLITNYSTAAITFQGNVFLDNTPVPLDKTGNGTICVFCHQGRESGFTLYATKLAPGKTITGSFFNPHYLGTGGMLWGVNGYEYSGNSYTANFAHQGANCPTCHMANATQINLNGGHTWWPNVATCNVAACHGDANLGPLVADAASKHGPAEPNVAIYRANFDTNNYTGDPGGASLSIADSIRVLQQKVIAILKTKGIEYDDLVYPYFFKAGLPHTSANAFTAWTPPLYRAAFNLSYTVKGLPSGATSQANVPNNSAAVHNYKYIIELLLDGIADLNGAPLAGAFRPVGTRPATVYGPGQ